MKQAILYQYRQFFRDAYYTSRVSWCHSVIRFLSAKNGWDGSEIEVDSEDRCLAELFVPVAVWKIKLQKNETDNTLQQDH
jgi:hypothetical protein